MAIRVIKGFSLLAGTAVTASVSYYIYRRYWQKLPEEIDTDNDTKTSNNDKKKPDYDNKVPDEDKVEYHSTVNPINDDIADKTTGVEEREEKTIDENNITETVKEVIDDIMIKDEKTNDDIVDVRETVREEVEMISAQDDRIDMKIIMLEELENILNEIEEDLHTEVENEIMELIDDGIEVVKTMEAEPKSNLNENESYENRQDNPGFVRIWEESNKSPRRKRLRTFRKFFSGLFCLGRPKVEE